MVWLYSRQGLPPVRNKHSILKHHLQRPEASLRSAKASVPPALANLALNALSCASSAAFAPSSPTCEAEADGPSTLLTSLLLLPDTEPEKSESDSAPPVAPDTNDCCNANDCCFILAAKTIGEPAQTSALAGAITAGSPKPRYSLKK